MLDAFISTMLAVMLAETGGRVQILAAMLAMRTARAGVLFALFLLAGLGPFAVSAWGGLVLRGWISVDAAALFMALALLFTAGSMLVGGRGVRELARGRIGPLAAGFGGGLFLILAGNGPFLIAANALRTGDALFTLLGGMAGLAAALAPAFLLREEWSDLPALLWLRRSGGLLFLILGGVAALDAFGLIGN